MAKNDSKKPLKRGQHFWPYFLKNKIPFSCQSQESCQSYPSCQMLQVYKIARHIWIDERNIVYKKTGRTEVVASNGQVLRAPRAGEKIYVDGRGNGLLFL